MNKHRIYPIVLLLLGLVAGACASTAPDGRGENIGSARSAISIPSRTPLPIGWPLGFVEILVADALTACSFSDQTTLVGKDAVTGEDILNLIQAQGDSYLSAVAHAMQMATCQEGTVIGDLDPLPISDTSKLAHWYLQRLAKDCNHTSDPGDISLPQTMQILPDPVPQTVTAGVGPIPVEGTKPASGPDWYNVNVDLANRIVRMPSVNLCIARELRGKAPGTAGGEELLLSASDQRELLEVTRERAQMAMIEFGQLAVAFAAPIAATTPSLFVADDPLPLVAAWGQGQGAAPQAVLQRMGLDFAAAVQLHTVVSQEIAELLGRSASAGEPRGGHATTAAAETWGPGSWRQRALASLFGGAPLATESDGSSPWQGVLGSASSNVGQPPAFSAVYGPSDPYSYANWPSSYLQPFFRADMSRPEAQRLLALARAYDVVDVATLATPIDSDCTAIDRAATAQALYVNTEVALESSECVSSIVGGTCGLTTLSPTCDACVDASCCTQLTACAGESTCTDCLSAALQSDNGPPQSCLSNPTFLGFATCYQQSSCTSQCTGPFTATCTVTGATLAPTCQPYGSTADFSGCHLYTEHGITPDHATLAASFLGDELEPFCATTNSRHFGSGARNLSKGSISASTVVSGGYHLSSDAQFVERGLMQIEPMYGRYAPYFTPTSVIPWSSASSQGFHGWGTSSTLFTELSSGESQRLAGAVSALVATRESLLVAERTIQLHDTGTSYFDEKDQMISVITGAVGTDSVVIRPVLAGVAGGDAVVVESGDTLEWSVSVTRSVSDPLWTAGGTYPLFVIYDDPGAASLVLSPNTTILNRSAASVLPTGPATVLQFVSSSSTLNRFSGGFVLQPEAYFEINSQATPHWVTLVAQVAMVNGVAQYVVLAANVPLNNPKSVSQGFYLSQGGSLTTYAERLLYGQPANPSKPAFDGFGFATSWVPPTDPTLFDAPAGEDAATFYLAQAQQAGQQATDAVQQAFTDLQQQATDGAAQAAATAQSQLLIQQQSDGLCGQGNTSCNTGVNPVVVLKTTLPACPPQPTATTDVVNCIANALLASAASPFPIANEVAKHKDELTAPAFANYDGGSLQAMFIQQWGAVRQVNDAAASVQAGLQAALSQVDAADLAFSHAQQQVKTDCSKLRIEAAVGAGLSVSGGFASATASFSPGPLIAQLEKCSDETSALASEDAQKIAALNDAILAMVQHASGVHDAVEKLAELSADIKLAVATAGRATAQAAQDADLASKTPTSNLSVYRAYSSFDLFRAQAMVDNARRYAVAARRAIEAKFLVNLSTMTADEALVAAPSTWADQVYDYDLSLPAAVGLSITTGTTSGIYPNKLADYVANLQHFVDGYAVSRPTATAGGDSNVITLLGPDTVLPLAGSQTIPGPSNTLQQSWSYFCPATSQWVQGSSTVPAAQACGTTAPTVARLVFSLDAWGRPNAYGVQAPPTQIFNTRWTRLAVNLVGTGIKNCALAADPLGCYSSSFVPYNLTHVGESWITDFEGAWRTLSIPRGQINQAKALAAEQWLDPISNGWAQPYVQAVQRVEFTGRPLDGTYQLELELAPEVQLGKIERIQILSDTSYWVRQQ